MGKTGDLSHGMPLASTRQHQLMIGPCLCAYTERTGPDWAWFACRVALVSQGPSWQTKQALCNLLGA